MVGFYEDITYASGDIPLVGCYLVVNSDICIYIQHGRDYDFYGIPTLNVRGWGYSNNMTVKLAGEEAFLYTKSKTLCVTS